MDINGEALSQGRVRVGQPNGCTSGSPSRSNVRCGSGTSPHSHVSATQRPRSQTAASAPRTSPNQAPTKRIGACPPLRLAQPDPRVARVGTGRSPQPSAECGYASCVGPRRLPNVRDSRQEAVGASRTDSPLRPRRVSKRRRAGCLSPRGCCRAPLRGALAASVSGSSGWRRQSSTAERWPDRAPIGARRTTVGGMGAQSSVAVRSDQYRSRKLLTE